MAMHVRIGAGFLSVLAGVFLAASPCAASSSSSSSDMPRWGTGFIMPILMYHHIRPLDEAPDQLGRSLSVSPEAFERQMQWLQENGYRTISMDLFVRLLRREIPAGLKFAVVTFDDGYDDNHTYALPILLRQRARAVFYVVADFVGRPGYLTRVQLRDLQSNGMQIASHTLRHVLLPGASPEVRTREVRESRARLREMTGQSILHIAYPYGAVDDVTGEAVRRAGYVTAVTTEEGYAGSGSLLLFLPRLRMGEKTELETLLP
ncbi:MAG: polysaccharide deacetylase family protein [Candidatus Peribacteraceae bacterium]